MSQKRKLEDDSIEVPESILSFVKTRMESFNCSAHDINHCIRVANIAKTIAETEENANVKLVYISALLHDVLDTKLSDIETFDDTSNKLLDILNNCKILNESEIKELFIIITSVGYKYLIDKTCDRTQMSINYWCVQDADLLDAMGAVGVARCFSFGGSRNRLLFGTASLPEEVISADKYATQLTNKLGSCVDHHFDKLLHLTNLIHTEYGKKLGKKRHQSMIAFLEALDDELLESKEPTAGQIHTNIAALK